MSEANILASSAQYQAFKEEYENFSFDAKSAMDALLARLKNLQFDSKRKNRRMMFASEPEARIKTRDSCEGKLARNGLELTAENLRSEIRDMAGIRLVLLYEDDVFKLMHNIEKQSGWTVSRVKDYLDDPDNPIYSQYKSDIWQTLGPKENGYCGVQATINVEVFYFDQKAIVPVDLQIREIYGQAWSKNEWLLCYKGLKDPAAVEYFKQLAEEDRVRRRRLMELRDASLESER